LNDFTGDRRIQPAGEFWVVYGLGGDRATAALLPSTRGILTASQQRGLNQQREPVRQRGLNLRGRSGGSGGAPQPPEGPAEPVTRTNGYLPDTAR